MKPITQFMKNSTCSWFCWSGSHIDRAMVESITGYEARSTTCSNLQYRGWSHVLQCLLRNRLQATKRYKNRSDGWYVNHFVLNIIIFVILRYLESCLWKQIIAIWRVYEKKPFPGRFLSNKIHTTKCSKTTTWRKRP